LRPQQFLVLRFQLNLTGSRVIEPALDFRR